jgi:RNA polymerase sigma-70 factor (ECF subfamily)
MPAVTAAAARVAEPLDELTLRRAQRGDERAWRALMERYRQPVHALIWRMLAGRARHRVEDLVQETFVRVLRALPGFDPDGPASLSTWMLTIAARLAMNELRRPEAVALAALGELGEAAAPAGERADLRAERRQLAAAIGAGVAALPDGQRAVLVLREYHDLDYAEIAAALELDPGTVKSRLARARAALRAHLIAAIPELAKERP